MTIKTLTTIHKLLIEENKRLTIATDIARSAYYKAEEDEAENAACLKDKYDSIWRAQSEAREALREFECKEW